MWESLNTWILRVGKSQICPYYIGLIANIPLVLTIQCVEELKEFVANMVAVKGVSVARLQLHLALDARRMVVAVDARLKDATR